MYAIEFQTQVKNGSIEVPDQYKDKVVGLVRIIILAEPKPASEDVIDRLLEAPLEIGEFVPFTREQVYEQ